MNQVESCSNISVHEDVCGIQQALAEQRYICTQRVAVTVYLAQQLKKPILVEGPPGVGKTELAKSCANVFSLPLIRLQCYEGLDETRALYEWKYGKQLLYTQMMKESVQELLQGATNFSDSIKRLHEVGDIFFSQDFLEPRPLLQALQMEQGCVLLIDEVDKASQEFEALLLEILADQQVSIPEVGTIHAIQPPIVFLTSNSTREMSDALKRRCLHLHIPFPDQELEEQIVSARVPEVAPGLLRHLISFVQELRRLDLKKHPAVSETIDWARTLLLLHAQVLDAELVRDTLNVILKYQDDIASVDRELISITHRAWRNLADT